MVQAGARLVLVPPLNRTTGPAHWDLCSGEWGGGRPVLHGGGGSGQGSRRCLRILWPFFGCSHPWGEVIRRFGTGEQAEVVELDSGRRMPCGKQLPLLSARRTGSVRNALEKRLKKEKFP